MTNAENTLHRAERNVAGPILCKFTRAIHLTAKQSSGTNTPAPTEGCEMGERAGSAEEPSGANTAPCSFSRKILQSRVDKLDKINSNVCAVCAHHLHTAADMSLVTLPHENDVTNASRTKRSYVSRTNCSVIVGSTESFASSVRRGASTTMSRERRARVCLKHNHNGSRNAATAGSVMGHGLTYGPSNFLFWYATLKISRAKSSSSCMLYQLVLATRSIMTQGTAAAPSTYTVYPY